MHVIVPKVMSFCDTTYWPLVIDVYTRYLIEVKYIRRSFLIDVECFSWEYGV